jgi:hypothetical protein
VARETVDQSEVQRVDQAMRSYQQGDCFLGDHGFIHLCLLRTEDEYEHQWQETPVVGLVLVSQSCDIVRSCADRPVVEMCPLVSVDQSQLASIVGGWRPQYVALPALSGQGLVVDLDRTMTVEKAVIVSWAHTKGLNSDAETRGFAQALARKRTRFAFPDDFNSYVEPLRKRLIEKHGKESPEGDALRAMNEIRVRAEPAWDAQEVQITFYFVRRQDSASSFDGKPWHVWCDGWMGRLVDGGRFKNPYGQVVDYTSMSAAEYLESDRLDLDQLSARTRTKQ